MSKTLLLLGGSRYLIPVIESAHEMDVEVVTADYIPGNIAHEYSDRYCNVSIVDQNAVLECACAVKADGIMSFAADPGVTTAAYVAEKLNLPYQGTYEAVGILQNKERFRSFLRAHDFACPEVYVFSSSKEANNHADALDYPVIVKPVDSAGSKGCSRVDGPHELANAIEYALSFSRSRNCIVEQFLEKACPSSDADSFSVDGRFECVSFTSQLFDSSCPNPYAPAAYLMPADMPQIAQNEFESELQRLSSLLGLRSGVYNIETRVATDGKLYIMEVSPRGGGNRLSEMLRFATSGEVDLISASVQAALNMPIEKICRPVIKNFWHQEILHSDHPGIFKKIEYAAGFKEAHVFDEQVWTPAGSKVEAFSSASFAFGSVMLEFESKEELDDFHQHKNQYMKVIVE